MKCSYCDREFEGARADARFCSSVCRLKSHRETDNGKLETDNENLETDKFLDLGKDLKLDIGKDLGIHAWTKDGVFIKPEITIEQVRRIRRLVEAKRGWEAREYA